MNFHDHYAFQWAQPEGVVFSTKKMPSQRVALPIIYLSSIDHPHLHLGNGQIGRIFLGLESGIKKRKEKRKRNRIQFQNRM